MLNPDDNLYSVAPVGHIVIIGRQVALKGGITRDNAINLLTWLILSTNATPDEIRAAIVKANKPTPFTAAISRFAAPTATVTPIVPQQVPVAGQSVAAFIGDVDTEEQAALDEVKAACEAVQEVPSVNNVPPPVRTAAPVPTTPARPIGTPIVPPVAVATIQVETIPTVDVDGIGKAWGVS
jgi:hypothetical protein